MISETKDFHQKKKGLIRRVPAIVILIMSLAIFTACSSELETTDTMDNLLYSQEKADERIEKELKSADHSFEDPLVIDNPYYIAPLTAIVIFNTEEATPIEMTVNDGTPVKFEKSKKHAIPVYGLYDGYDNKVTLKDNAGNTKEIEIKTEEYKGGVMTVKKSQVKPSDEFFLVSPDYERTSAYDEKGKLLWYLDTPDNEGAVIFLGGGRFLISDPYQGAGGIRINYSGFMEMDYLGKVRKLYLGEYGYHHEIVPVNGGKEFLIPGHDEESPFMQDVIYMVDAKTMKIVKKVDFYPIFSKLAPKWTNKQVKESAFNFVVNGVDYDEESGDAVVSVRATGMLIRVNMDTGEIKWIFADPKNVPEGLKGYLLRPTDDTRYPYGQHAPTFLPENRISYHNNDVDFSETNLKLSNLKGQYSSSEIIKVNEEDMTVSTEWTFDDGKEILSRMSGSLEFLPDGHKLISYGSALKEEVRKSGEDADIGDFKLTEGLMKELDDSDKVVWEATFPGVIHKVYRSSFYDAEAAQVPNYEVVPYKLIDGQDKKKHLGKKFDAGDIASELDDAEKFDADFSIMINRAVPEKKFNDTDEVNILFVSEKNKEDGRLFPYKKKDELQPIVNSGRYGIRIAGLTGKQRAYIQVNGTWYSTGRIFDFD